MTADEARVDVASTDGTWRRRRGIYTLANDVVYHQLVALLNSLERNGAAHLPVCVIPYDDNLALVRGEISRRSGVSLFDDRAALDALGALRRTGLGLASDSAEGLVAALRVPAVCSVWRCTVVRRS